MSIFRIGSRESRLAVIQSEMVKTYLESEGVDVRILTMKTTGDRILDRPLEQVGGKGLFVKELERALLENRTDLSVHSLKDVPMTVSEKIPLIGFSHREDPRDVLVLPQGISRLDPAKPIGCSSKRRILQAGKLFPHMEFQSIRGNVNTRLQKLDAGEYSALILAAAGLKRLHLESRISRYFTVEEMIPSAGQGILALQGRQGQDYSALQGFLDEDMAIVAACERAFVQAAQGDCSSPLAAYASLTQETITLRGMYCEGDGRKEYVTGVLCGAITQPCELGRTLAIRLKQQYDAN